MSELLSVADAAKELHVGKRTLEDMIAKGEVVSLKIRRRRFIERVEIRRQLALGERRGRVA